MHCLNATAYLITVADHLFMVPQCTYFLTAASINLTRHDTKIKSSQTICTNWEMQLCDYTLASERNLASTLLNPCCVELGQL